MASLEEIMESSQKALKFHMEYTREHLYWFHFFQQKISLSPKMVYLFEDRVFAFFEEPYYEEAKRLWHKYITRYRRKTKYHFRLLEYSDDLATIIKNWYCNIKNLQIDIVLENHCFLIELQPPKNLRQFVIGKQGVEIEMLTQFLDSCIYGDYNFRIILN